MLFCIIEILFEFIARKRFADRRRTCISFKLLFAEKEVGDFPERQFRLIRLRDRRDVIGVPVRKGEFLSASDHPLTERFVFGELFEEGTVLRICAQAKFQKVFRLRVLLVDTKIIDNVASLVELIGAVFVFGEFPDHAAVDERCIRVIIPGIRRIPFAVFKRLLLRLQFLCKPAYAVAVSEVVILHIADITFRRMHAVYGNLLASPMLVLNGRNGDGYFYEFLFPNGQICVIAYRARLPGLDFKIAPVNLVHNVFWNRFYVFLGHGITSGQFHRRTFRLK